MKKLLSNSFLYVLGEGVSKGLIFVITPLLINQYDTETYGQFSLYLAYLPLFTFIFDLGGRSSVKRYILEDEANINQFIHSISILVFIIGFIYLMIIQYFKLGVFYYYLGINACLFILIEFQLNKYQLQNKAIKYNALFILRNASPYLFFIILIFLIKPKLSVFFLIQGAFFFLIFVVLAINIRKDFPSYLQIIKFLKYSLKFSLPLIIAPVSGILLNVSDRYIIELYYSDKEVGLYSLAYNVSNIFLIGLIAINKPWQTFILKALKDNNQKAISLNFKKYLMLALLGISIIFVLRENIILILANSSYLMVSSLIPIILIGHFFYFLYMMHSNVAFYHKNTFLFVLPAIIAAIINIISNFVLIPKYGYEIAAYTTMISYLIEFLIIYLICRLIYKFSIW